MQAKVDVMGELVIFPKGSWDYCDKCNKATPLGELYAMNIDGELVMFLCVQCQL
jgi:hypothetical protein